MFGIQEQHQQWPVTTAQYVLLLCLFLRSLIIICLSIVSWLENLPLVTAARAFHIMHPERIGWDFIPDAGDHDRTTFQHILWTLPRTDDCDYSSEEEQRIGEESVAVIVQPPWILSDQDIMEFCSRQSVRSLISSKFELKDDQFPDYVAPGNAFPRPFTSSKQRAWAKVWDTCVRSHVRWFVVTSYHKWVFGKFSQGAQLLILCSLLMQRRILRCACYRSIGLQCTQSIHCGTFGFMDVRPARSYTGKNYSTGTLRSTIHTSSIYVHGLRRHVS